MKRWYVLQIFAGYEAAIKKEIERRVAELGLGDFFGEVLIPSAKVKSFIGAAQDQSEQQLFPGYLLIEMDLVPEAVRLVLSTQRVFKFLGGKDPVALSQKEIDRVVSQVHGHVPLVAPKSDYVVGAEVDISSGPFAGFVGVIDRVDEESERLTVMVSIFGRMTPIELSFDQVKQ
jgi:transcription termination/antitermination protein NusG